MPLLQLTEEQTRTWMRAQKDRWWFENIYRGDLPQLTLRAALTGFFLGGILTATALYIGGKTGITIGVGPTSVILAFAMFKLLHRAGISSDFTVLENNCAQSIATAAGYMITPLITKGHTIWVECCEPICAGLISGAALIGILNAMVNAVLGSNDRSRAHQEARLSGTPWAGQTAF